MDWELVLFIVINNTDISDIFPLRLVTKEWHEIIKDCIFYYKIKYYYYEYKDYLKKKYNKIQLYCTIPRDIIDISMLGGLHTLNISNCKNIKKYPEPNNIIEYIS